VLSDISALNERTLLAPREPVAGMALGRVIDAGIKPEFAFFPGTHIVVGVWTFLQESQSIDFFGPWLIV
jgi:hypothetical protein